MRVKLTPELAYVIGLWSTRKCNVGICVRGMPHVREYFVNAIIRMGLTSPNKILFSGKKVYFYHTGYKKFFTEVENDLSNRFRSKNNYSAAFLAGMFDAAGKIQNQNPLLKGISLDKQILIERLGFRLTRYKEYLIPTPPKEFIEFIKPYSQALRSGNERDPCP